MWSSGKTTETPPRPSLREEAQQRADSVRSSRSTPAGRETASTGQSPHPLQHVTPASASTPSTNKTQSPSVLAAQARQDWRRHGPGLSQVVEDKRKQGSSGFVVRVLSAEQRVDPGGANYTAYVVSVQSTSASHTIPHRYGDFHKLHTLLQNKSVIIQTAFPAKHWAGRFGNWTPSLSLAPQQHEELIAYRKVQLDLWLVDVLDLYNQNHPSLNEDCRTAIYDFLFHPDQTPSQERNDLVKCSWVSSSNPLSFTLGSSIRQAAYMVHHMCCSSNHVMTESDQSIPLDLLHQARGLCFLTVAKAGLVVSGKVGTGLMLARLSSRTTNHTNSSSEWSAPSAIGTVGVGWGPQLGGEVTHYLIVLTSQQAVESLCHDTSVRLGAELGISVGPLGRSANVSSSTNLLPAYAYAHAQGLFVGMSLEGSVLTTRNDVNAKFYGQHVSARELLVQNTVPPPRAAEPLYQALKEALEVTIPSHGLRPSQLFSSSQHVDDGHSRVGGTATNSGVGAATNRPPTIETMSNEPSSLFDSTSPG